MFNEGATCFWWGINGNCRAKCWDCHCIDDDGNCVLPYGEIPDGSIHVFVASHRSDIRHRETQTHTIETGLRIFKKEG
jgi:hypothetical protein